MTKAKTQHSDIDAAQICIISAGAFGSALAATAVAGGHSVTIFDRSEAHLTTFRNDPALQACHYKTFSEGPVDFGIYDLIILAPSAQALREVAEWLNKNLISVYKESSKVPQLFVLSAAKGIEQKTLQLPHQILKSILPSSVSVGTLSGPSFAKELREGLPTSVVVASQCENLRQKANYSLHRSFFRVYESTDIAGVEIAGALKNVIAMVAGAADGLKIGNNARAAVITRGLGEIVQLGVSMGADPMTFLGLSGIGDLILTCTGDLSRNRQFGMRLATGERADTIIESMGVTVEGAATTQSAYELSQKYKLDTPIIDAAYAVIYEKHSIHDAIYALLSRPQKGEFDWMRNIKLT